MNEPEKVTADSLFIPSKRGRPRTNGSRVTTWLSERQHDRLIQLAESEQKSVSALVRHLLTLHISR